MARVLLFGPLRDLAGWRERVFTPPPTTLFDLHNQISLEDADLAEALKARGVQIAVNRMITRGNAPLSALAEVAFLPPMSGG